MVRSGYRLSYSPGAKAGSRRRGLHLIQCEPAIRVLGEKRSEALSDKRSVFITMTINR